MYCESCGGKHSSKDAHSHTRLRLSDLGIKSRTDMNIERQIGLHLLSDFSPRAHAFFENAKLFEVTDPVAFSQLAKEISNIAKLWGHRFEEQFNVPYNHVVDCVYLGGYWSEKGHDFDIVEDASWLMCEDVERPPGFAEFNTNFMMETINGMKLNAGEHYPTLRDYYNSVLHVGTSGSDPTFKYFDVEGERIRATKSFTMVNMSYEEFEEWIMQTERAKLTLVTKNEAGKLRVVIQVDSRVYHLLRYLFGERIYGTLPFECALGEDWVGKHERMKTTSSDANMHTQFPADFDNFQGAQNKSELLEVVDLLFKARSVREGDELFFNNLVNLMENSDVYSEGEVVGSWTHGMPSGILLTSMVNSMQNRCFHKFMSERLRPAEYVRGSLIKHVNQGDDAQLSYAYWSDALLHYYFGDKWWGMNRYKFFISGQSSIPLHNRMEFLRVIINGDGSVDSYGCRQLLSLYQSKPWGLPPLDESQELRELITNCNGVSNRFNSDCEFLKPYLIRYAKRRKLMRYTDVKYNGSFGLQWSPGECFEIKPGVSSCHALSGGSFIGLESRRNELEKIWGKEEVTRQWFVPNADALTLGCRTPSIARSVKRRISDKSKIRAVGIPISKDIDVFGYEIDRRYKNSYFGCGIQASDESTLFKDWLIKTPVRFWGSVPNGNLRPVCNRLRLLAKYGGKGLAIAIGFDEISVPTVLGKSLPSDFAGHCVRYIKFVIESDLRVLRNMSKASVKLTLFNTLTKLVSTHYGNFRY